MDEIDYKTRGDEIDKIVEEHTKAEAPVAIQDYTLPPKKNKIRQCPSCGSPIEIKDPWKALFRMPTMNEWIILFMLIMILVISWAYKHDVAQCREYVNNIDLVCLARSHNVTVETLVNLSSLNVSPQSYFAAGPALTGNTSITK